MDIKHLGMVALFLCIQLLSSLVHSNEINIKEHDYYQDEFRSEYEKGLDCADRSNYKCAYSVWLSLAERGHNFAQQNIAKMYSTGKGVTKNDNEAVKWYKKAAEQGVPISQFTLGTLYSKGKGVKKDNEQASIWFRKAAIQGHSPSQYNLALRYESGKGINKDLKQSLYWHLKAAEQGLAESQYNLGMMYDQGVATDIDFVESAKWYLRAAEQGHPYAQYNISVTYYKGQGVDRDYESAFYWIYKYNEQTNWSALKQLNNIKDKLSYFIVESNSVELVREDLSVVVVHRGVKLYKLSEGGSSSDKVYYEDERAIGSIKK